MVQIVEYGSSWTPGWKGCETPIDIELRIYVFETTLKLWLKHNLFIYLDLTVSDRISAGKSFSL